MNKLKYYTETGSNDAHQFISPIQYQVSSMLAKKGYLRTDDIEHFTKFIICYTEYQNEYTQLLVKKADNLNIPIFDCGKYDNAESLKTSLSLFLKNVLNR